MLPTFNYFSINTKISISTESDKEVDKKKTGDAYLSAFPQGYLVWDVI